MGKTVSNILIVVFTAIIAVSGYHLWKIFHEYHVGEQQYESTAGTYVHTSDDTPADDYPPTVCPISVDFEGLLAENSDVVGWIYSEDTQINYPVMRGDSNETYLHTMINGEYNSAGSIFMDFRCQPDLSDYNTILYGHHMKNGSMFASLHQYTNQSFYDEHKFMWYLTPDHVYRLDVIAGYIGDAEAEVYTIFQNTDELDHYLSFAASHSTFTPESVTEDINGIVVLSTCSYDSDVRFTVSAVRVDEHEWE